MGYTNSKRLFAVIALAMLLPPQTSQALLNIDGTRNQVFVFGHAAIGFSSNIFASSGGKGDYSLSATVGAELKRRAGIISVNSTFKLDYVQYAKLREESSWNPSFNLELNKTTGRTTGAFTLNAFRVSRADGAVNVRTTSWNFPLGLSIKYPVSDRFYATSSSSFLTRRYSSGSNLLNFLDYSESLDGFYVFTSKLDLIGGYRVRVSKTNVSKTVDHAVTFGATGGLIPKVNGSVRLGYQFRNVSATSEEFKQVTATVALAWNATRKFTVSGQVGRDFSTTATAQSVDTLTTTLRATYVFTRRFEVNGGVGYGRNKFLGRLIPFRRDDFFSWDVGAQFSFSEHLRIGLNYNYLHNWSTLSFSDFTQYGYSLDVSSRF